MTAENNDLQRKKKRRRIIIIVAAVVVLLVLVNVFSSGETLPQVTVEEAQARTLSSIVTGPGHVRPAIEVDLIPLSAGEVTQVAVVEGQAVKEGDLIVEIDPEQSRSLLSQSRAAYSAASAQLDLAQANLTQAEDNLRRQRQLYEEGLISNQEWEMTQTQFEVLRAQVEAAKSQAWGASAQVRAARDSLNRTRYTSPMDGVVVALNVEVGDITTSSLVSVTPLATIASLEGMKVVADIDETEVVELEVGQTAVIRVEAFPRQRFAGHVAEIARSAMTSRAGTQEEVVNFEVKAVIDDAVPPELLPGMSATLEVTTKTEKDALSVPISAIVLRDVSEVQGWLGEGFTPADKLEEVEGVFVLVEDHTEFRPVVTGISDEAYIQILEGLSAGETVISGPYKELRGLSHGTEVEVTAEPTE